MKTKWPFVLLKPTVDLSARDIALYKLDSFSGLLPTQIQGFTQLGIVTIYDLAYASIFKAAALVHETIAERGVEYPLPGDLFAVGAEKPENVLDAPLDVLRFVDDDTAEVFKNQIGLETLEQVALWPYFRAAREIVNQALTVPEDTDLAPMDLLPTNGQFAVQREEYSRSYIDFFGTPKPNLPENDVQPEPAKPERAVSGTFALERGAFTGGRLSRLNPDLFDKIKSAEGQAIAPFNTFKLIQAQSASNELSSLKLSDLGQTGLKNPALGAQIVFEKTLTAEGVALGRMLRSVTLAPGESVNIAVVDWTTELLSSRQDEARQQELMDARSNASREQNSEQSANSDEETNQESTTDQTTTQDSQTDTTSGTIGASVPIGPASVGASVSKGRSETSSENTFQQDIAVSSTGRKNVHLEAMDKIVSEIHQQASADRNRRTSVVVETRQNQSTSSRTRTITNYNHMHTLSLHYYEVVQIYRMQVAAQSARPILYVPVEPVEFSDPEVIIRYRGDLIRAADNDEITRRLTSLDERVLADVQPKLAYEHRFESHLAFASGDAGITGNASLGHYRIPRNAKLTGASMVLMHGDNLPQAHPDAIQVNMKDGRRREFRIDYGQRNRIRYGIEFGEEFLVRDIDTISVTFPSDARGRASCHLSFDIGGVYASVYIAYQSSSGFMPLLTFSDPAELEDISTLLSKDPMKYSMAVWRSLDPSSLISLFAGKTFSGLDLTGAVEPKVVAEYGNMLGFPLAIPDDDTMPVALWWKDWLFKNFNPDTHLSDLISLPSDGIHAEGVLGRANTAEKFDFTRFWDWQESPIPLTAGPAHISQPGQAQSAGQASGFDSSLAAYASMQNMASDAFSTALTEAMKTNLSDTDGITSLAASAAEGALSSIGKAGEASSQAATAVTLASLDHMSKMSNARLGAAMAEAKAKSKSGNVTNTINIDAKGGSATGGAVDADINADAKGGSGGVGTGSNKSNRGGGGGGGSKRSNRGGNITFEDNSEDNSTGDVTFGDNTIKLFSDNKIVIVPKDKKDMPQPPSTTIETDNSNSEFTLFKFISQDNSVHTTKIVNRNDGDNINIDSHDTTQTDNSVRIFKEGDKVIILPPPEKNDPGIVIIPVPGPSNSFKIDIGDVTIGPSGNITVINNIVINVDGGCFKRPGPTNDDPAQAGIVALELDWATNIADAESLLEFIQNNVRHIIRTFLPDILGGAVDEVLAKIQEALNGILTEGSDWIVRQFGKIEELVEFDAADLARAIQFLISTKWAERIDVPGAYVSGDQRIIGAFSGAGLIFDRTAGQSETNAVLRRGFLNSVDGVGINDWASDANSEIEGLWIGRMDIGDVVESAIGILVEAIVTLIIVLFPGGMIARVLGGSVVNQVISILTEKLFDKFIAEYVSETNDPEELDLDGVYFEGQPTVHVDEQAFEGEQVENFGARFILFDTVSFNRG